MFQPTPTNVSLGRKPHPLDNVSVKLERAYKHIIELNNELAAFKRLHPDTFGTHLDPATGKFTHTTIQFDADIDTGRLSVIAGEVLHQLRSSLDHLVAQMLIGIPANATTIDEILESSYFPICVRSIQFQSLDWSKIPNISAAARKTIGDCQPCNRTDGLPPEDHPLAVLAGLNNIDKHRSLIRIVRPTRITRVDFGPQFQGSISHIGPAVLGSSQTYAVLSEGSVPIGTPVDVQFHGTSEIAFKEVGTQQVQPIIPTVQGLLDFVGSLVNDFAAKFF